MTTETEAGVSEQRLKELIAIAEHRRIDGSDWKEEMALALRELLAARATLASMRANEWQEIASAPRDGTRVMLAMQSGYVTIAQFCSDGYWRNSVDQDGGFKPTHWMPLPAPPERAL